MNIGLPTGGKEPRSNPFDRPDTLGAFAKRKRGGPCCGHP